MRHHNTVLRDLLKLVPWHRFEALVEDYDADARVRQLSTKGQFLALLYGQFSGASSLREIVTGLSSHAARLYHLGADPVRDRPSPMPMPSGRPRYLSNSSTP